MSRLRPILLFLPILTISCKPIAYFNTPNDAFRKDCIIYMLDGTEKKGKITIMLETGHDADEYIRLLTGNAEEKILIDSITFYQVNKDHYFPKKIDLDGNGAESLLFVKRLTKENSRMDMYELYRQGKQTSDGADLYLYFISIPGHSRFEVWSIGGKNFFPNFDEKMSSLVEDCPALAIKIKQGQKGYSLGQFSLSLKKFEVFKRIVDEYNDCR